MTSGDHQRQAEPADAPTLLQEVLQGVLRLVRDEMTLARLEVRRSLSRAGTGIALLIGAALLLLTALHVVAAAVVTALIAAGLAPPIASLVVAVGTLILAATAFFSGKARLDPKTLAPSTAAKNIRRDIETIKETAHG